MCEYIHKVASRSVFKLPSYKQNTPSVRAGSCGVKETGSAEDRV